MLISELFIFIFVRSPINMASVGGHMASGNMVNDHNIQGSDSTINISHDTHFIFRFSTTSVPSAIPSFCIFCWNRPQMFDCWSIKRERCLLLSSSDCSLGRKVIILSSKSLYISWINVTVHIIHLLRIIRHLQIDRKSKQNILTLKHRIGLEIRRQNGGAL